MNWFAPSGEPCGDAKHSSCRAGGSGAYGKGQPDLLPQAP